MHARPKALWLTLLIVIGLLAAFATNASAEGKLRVEGKVLPTGEEVELAGEGGTYKSLVPGLSLTLECKKILVTATAANLNIVGIEHAHGSGHALAHECVIVGNKFCTIYPTAADRTAKTNAGLILASGLALETLHKNKEGVIHHYLVLTPLKGSSAFSTTFYGGSLCTLPSETVISGTAAVKLGDVLTELTEHELGDLTETEEAELGVHLFYGNEPLIPDEGTGKGHLIGKFLGKKFSLD